MKDYTKRQIQIIERAVDLIAAGGIQELTIKNLAATIGISEPGIYRHFQNKQEILEALLDHFGSDTRDYLSNVVKSRQTSLEKIGVILKYHFETFNRRPALSAVIFSEDIFLNDRHLAEIVLGIMKQSQEAFLKIIASDGTERELRGDIPAQHLVTIIMGSLRLLVNKWHLSGHAFDLIEEGNSFWKSLKRVIAKNVQ